MILYKEFSWRYWGVTVVLLYVGLSGQAAAFYLAVLLSAIQVVHFYLREGRLSAFPVQVRIAFTLVVLLALWHPLNWVFWVPAIGGTALVLFGYCPLARILSLMPWNRSGPLSWHLVGRTFLSPPAKGNIMQGLPAAK